MTSFSKAFAAARKEKGAGKTFRWPDKNGKLYTTDYASEKSTTPSSSPRAKAKPTKEAPAAKAESPTRVAAGTPFAPSRTNPKVIPLGKTKHIGGRAAEAVKGLIGALKGKPSSKPKEAFKTPNRAEAYKKAMSAKKK
jgi:hypothetical protein